MSSETEIRPFRVEIPDEAIADLRRRIAATRWPSEELVADRSQGVQLATLQELARYWAADYDLRKCEAKLNALQQCKTDIDGLDIHFIHVEPWLVAVVPRSVNHSAPSGPTVMS
jgi:epoxide hydrolase-like protein